MAADPSEDLATRTEGDPIATVDAGVPPLLRRLADSPEIGIIAALIVAVIVFTSINPLFLSVSDLQNPLGVDLAGFGILAVGESIVIMTGGIDLSVGSLTAFFVVGSAWLNVSEHIPVGFAFALTILAGAAWGLWHAFWITRLGVAPFVITLVTFIFAAGADEALAPNPITISSPPFLALVGSSVAGVPIAVVIFAVIALAAWFFLERTYIGRQIYAVGGNKEAARLAGIPTARRITLAYVASGSCAAVAGLIVASRITSGTADSVSGYELIAIAAAVIGGVSLIGGQGRIVGAVAGAALLVALTDGLVTIGVNAYYQPMVVGVVLFFAVILDAVRTRFRGRAAARTGLEAGKGAGGEPAAAGGDP
ncbi:MAG TPA: ABC transporter permease [Solirubrobacteraceae bacterium]|nr:ABC transporter permease [Solirubrobacteraceae bacterium]